MGILPPSSRDILRLRFSPFDIIWAAVSPLAALYIRDALILSSGDLQMVALYCAVSVFFALVAFVIFRLRDGMSRYFSVHDAIEVAKAVILAELMTAVVLFTFTRLDGIPRSTPVIHALILGAGLIAARASSRIAHNERATVLRRRPLSGEGIVLIGLNEFSYAYIKCLETFSRGRARVIAILDERPRALGRSVHGVRVMGPPSHLESLIEEFQVHGIHTNGVVISGDERSLPEDVQRELQRVCTTHDIRLDFLPLLFGIANSRTETESGVATAEQRETTAERLPDAADASALTPYVPVKRLIDFAGALGLLLALSPLWILASLIAWLDVGSPIFFWQQRIGFNGNNFLLYKLRTLRTPFDWQGRKIPEEERLSWIGQLLRRTRLDEWPQLLNVLVGDMSLIGPRPLLPKDQPDDPTKRLKLRPGLTGWAQVRGGRLLSPQEKDSLDEWYVQNVSLWLDVRILWLTVLFLGRGDRRELPRMLCTSGPGSRDERVNEQDLPIPAAKA